MKKNKESRIKNKIINRLTKIIGKDQISYWNHSKNYLIGNIATQALSFISIPIFTRLLLPDEYGIIAIVNSISQVFLIIMMLGLHASVTRNYYEKDTEFPVFLGSVTIFLFGYNLIFIIVMFLFKDAFADFLNINPILFFIGIVNGSITGLISLYTHYLQASRKSRRFAILSFIKGAALLVIAVIWVLSLSEDRYLGRIYSLITVNGIFAVYSIVQIIKISSFKFNWQKVKYALKYGVPLVPHLMSGFVLAQFDRLIVNQISGANDAGLYSFAYNIGMLMNIVVMSLNRSWTPIFYSKINDGKHDDIQNMVKNNSKIALLMALCLIFFSKEIVMLIADPAYFDAFKLVPIIVISYIFVYYQTIYANYAFYRKKTYLISIITIIACGVNIALNYVFIPKYGYIAAAYTTLFSYVLLLILHLINSKFVLKENVPSIKVFAGSFMLFVALIVVYFYISSLDLHWLVLVVLKLILIGIYAVYIVWRKIKK